jgi:predicted amidophosphoribosyltransferase
MPLALRLAPILAAVAPPLCWSCRAPAPAGEPLCRGCRSRLRFLGPEVARVGALPVWAAVAYEGPARDLVRGLKYRGAAGLAEALAAQMAASAPRELLPPRMAASAPRALLPQRMAARAPGEPLPQQMAASAQRELLPQQMAASAQRELLPPHGGPVLVPVPATPARRRRRGYDQAALLAAAFARRRGLPTVACLARSGGGPQVGRGREARLVGLSGAIEVRSRPPPEAILVDDVVTTGATLVACAWALKQAGCERVVAIAYARALGR